MLTLQFAPSSTSGIDGAPAQDEYDQSHGSCFNGYHLLNEVSTGGTLSSLFSILSLFTEDIKVSWTPPQETSEPDTVPADEHEDDHATVSRPESRADSDVSQMDGEISNGDIRPLTPLTARPTRARSSSVGSVIANLPPTSQSHPQSSQGKNTSQTASRTTPSSPLSLHPVEFLMHNASQSASPIETSRADIPGPKLSKSEDPSYAPRGPSSAFPQGSMSAMQGTIARATVDTTLAVIPAEAFRKLTKKFPKASGTVVQVVLERFSRVTFMTGRWWCFIRES